MTSINSDDQSLRSETWKVTKPFLRKQSVYESLTGKFVKAARIIATELTGNIFNISSRTEPLKTSKKPGRLSRKICSSNGGSQS
jgi:hypothetical protein